MNILVTGANGLLGHYVVNELLNCNYTVRIIVRSKRNIYFDLEKVQVFEGNFYDYETLKNAASGCDAIIHIAAITATDLLKYDDYHQINVEGTSKILNIADELNINKLVYVSTANTVGFGDKEQPANETFPIQFPFTKSFYAQSKVESEKRVIEASKKADNHFIIINPTFMIGTMDTKPSSGKLMLMGYKKAFMPVPNGGKNFVAVTSVSTAVCNALMMGTNGERYLASGVNLSFREFYKIQSRIGGYAQQIIVLPSALLEIAGKAGDIVRMFGVKTDVCSMNLNQLTIREYYTNQKAHKELEMPNEPIETAIKEALGWFKEKGKIK